MHYEGNLTEDEQLKGAAYPMLMRMTLSLGEYDKDGSYVPQREVRAVFPKEGSAFGSMKDLKAQTVAIFSYIDPILAVLLSAFLLKESMDMLSVIGAVLILGSTFISEMIDKK